MAYADAVKRGASQTRRHFFIDVCPSFRYYRYRIPLAKDVGRRHRPTERVRFPRARARHLRSRAVSEQRPAGTMTGLRGARWTWTGNSASQEARPELSCGVGSLQQVPGGTPTGGASRGSCVRRLAYTCLRGRAPRPLLCPPAQAVEDEGGGAEVGDTRLPAFHLLLSRSPHEAQRNAGAALQAARSFPDFAEPVIGPATSGRTRWVHPGYRYSSGLRIGLCCT